MQVIKKEDFSVYESFYALTEKISAYAPYDEKQKELILCAVFATHGSSAIRGLGHHVIRASQLGATRQEILGAILLIMPVVGITITTQAVDKAEETLQEIERNQQSS